MEKVLIRLLEVCVGLAVVLIVCALYQGVVKLDLGAAANWIQAIGSVLAIYGALEVGRRQRESDKETASLLAAESSQRLKSVVKAIADDVYQQCLDVWPTIEDEEGEFDARMFRMAMNYDKASFTAAIARVKEIPIFELDSEKIAKRVIAFQEESIRLAGWLETAHRIIIGPTLPEDKDLHPDEVRKMVLEYLHRVRHRYTEIVATTGGVVLTQRRDLGRWTPIS